MADPTQPNLGYGQRGEAPIDAVNQWMRTTPWYNDLIRSFGQDPSNVHLNDQQKQQVIQAAQANGVVVDEGHNGQEIDDSGNFHAKSHKLRNTLIVAGLAGTALATMGAAGVFAGAGGAVGGGAAGTGAAIAAPTAGSTVGAGLAAPAALSPIAFGAPGAAATTALTSGGVAGAAGGAGAAGVLAATSPWSGASTLPAGATSSMGSTSGGGALSTLGGYGKKFLSGLNTEAVGRGLAGASQASANNRGVQAELALDQNRDLESQLLAREREKREAQDQAYRNAMLGDRAATWKPLVRPAGISGSYQGSTPESQGAGSELFNQAMSRLSSPDLRNGQTGMPAYKNLGTDPTFQDNLKPGALETATSTGSWLLPLFSGIFGKK